MKEIDIFGLFEDLKTKGHTKLSDHEIKPEPETEQQSGSPEA